MTNLPQVPELWEDNGDAYIYLFPRESGRGPSFKVPSMVLSSSQPLLRMLHGYIQSSRERSRSWDGRGIPDVEDGMRNFTMRGPGTPPYTPKTNTSDEQWGFNTSADSFNSVTDTPRELHLYFPVGLTGNGPEISQHDFQALVDVRNLFAFLTGQPLVATKAHPSTFSVFLSIAAILKNLEFTNFSGSTYGEAATASFGFYVHELRLADVRHSREKTIEGLILGERMRCEELYNEAFAHAVGKYSAIKGMKAPFSQISQNTRNRLERSSLDLTQRVMSASHRLADFDFPSVFAGIGSSTSSEESKFVRFKAWKAHFLSMRKLVLGYYKDLHGQWPPRASSKKNHFVEGGLNRLVLKILYTDLSNLYDYLADRESLTTRSYNTTEDEDESRNISPQAAALRKLLSEFDRSSPPVCPPIPFDVPNLPTIATVEPTFPTLSPVEQHQQSTRKLKDYEHILILTKSHNLPQEHKTPFLETFKSFEEKESRGYNVQELVEMRIGHWIFMYACLQSLPLLVVDAAGLSFTDGVEYFLCVPPMGNPPWIEDASAVKMSWYGVQGGAGVVSLPSDVVNHGVEATYRRSHCWVVAEKWINAHHDSELPPIPDSGTTQEPMSPLSPPPGFGGDGDLSLRPSVRQKQRSSSAHGNRSVSSNRLSIGGGERSRSRQHQRQSIALGLERLPIPAGQEQNWGPAGSASAPGSGGSSRAVSRGSSPYGGPGHGRIGSRGQDMPTPVTVGGPEAKGSTFDDILGSMEQESKGKKGGKKKRMREKRREGETGNWGRRRRCVRGKMKGRRGDGRRKLQRKRKEGGGAGLILRALRCWFGSISLIYIYRFVLEDVFVYGERGKESQGETGEKVCDDFYVMKNENPYLKWNGEWK